MSGQSPATVLYSSDGYELAVVNNTAIPSGTRALLISGTGPDGYSRYVPSTINGALGTSEMSNSFVVQSAALVTASGSQLVTGNFFGVQEIAIVVNVGTVTGAGSIVYTIQEVDPGDGITVYGSSSSTVSISGGNAPGVFTALLNTTTSTSVKVSWVVTGSFSATIYTTVTTKGTPATQAISGSITATNPSVGTDGAAALGFDTQVGGKVTTAAPTYTTGNLDALSLTTLGGLRIDGVYAVATANATAADVMNSGGYVTTAAPTYTTGQLNPLSLTTAGDLRVVANQGTSPWVVSGTVTANQGTSPWVTSVTGTVAVTQSTSPWVVSGTGGTFDNRSVGADAAAALGFDTQVGGKTTTSAPTYTTGNLDVLSLTTLGGLRIDGVYVAGTANATAADLMANGGYVTTAAPTYTTGQLNALSLDTAGNLRVLAAQGTTPWQVTTNKATVSAVTSVAQATTNTTLLTTTATRQFASIYNNSGQKMFIKLGTTASTSSYSIQLMPNSYWEVPVDWAGNIDAVWSGNGSGNALVTELTP